MRKPWRSRRSARPFQNASGGLWAGSAAAPIASQKNPAIVSGPRLLDQAVELGERCAPGRVEPVRARRDVEDVREVGAERAVEARPSCQPERGDGGAVVGLGGRDEAPAAGLAALHVVAPRQAQCRLVRLGPAGDEVRPREPLGRDVDQLAGEPLLRRVREALVVDEREPGRLVACGLEEVGAPVAERRRHRAAAHRVEVPRPGGVLEPDAAAADGDGIPPVELRGEEPGVVAADGRLHPCRSLAHGLQIMPQNEPLRHRRGV